MSCNLNLQRDSKVFFSTVDLAGGATMASMVPSNTWRVEVLAGYAVSQSATTQDITALESGTTPDRSTSRFNTSIDPVDWNFQVYMRPTGLANDHSNVGATQGVSTANVKPIADWYLWQALLSNTPPALGTSEQSAWANTTGVADNVGIFETVTRTAVAGNTHPHRSNFGSAQENHIYFQLDNVVYQVSNAAVNEATVDAAIDSIASTTWTGQGTNLIELTGTIRNNAISVFGGTMNDGSVITDTANACNAVLNKVGNHHPWDTMNVEGTTGTNAFIKNRLSTININHKPSAGGGNVNYTFPVTSLSFTWNNNITYLTPEELNSLNAPIGNFTGAKTVTGSFSAYLRHGTTSSSTLLKNIINDTRVSSVNTSNANLIVGGTTAPFAAFFMPAVNFEFPVHNIDDIIQIDATFVAQESNVNCGLGDELSLLVQKS